MSELGPGKFGEVRIVGVGGGRFGGGNSVAKRHQKAGIVFTVRNRKGARVYARE